MGYTYREKSVR